MQSSGKFTYKSFFYERFESSPEALIESRIWFRETLNKWSARCQWLDICFLQSTAHKNFSEREGKAMGFQGTTLFAVMD